MRVVYSLLLYLFLPFIFIRLWWRGFGASAYRHRWHERLGFIIPFPSAPRIWLHAVSVGEVQASVPLLQALQTHYPTYRLLVTTMTPTGSECLTAALPNLEHVYLPYDTPDAVARFLQRTQPTLGLIMETELWFNLLYACRQRQIPTFLLNARLSKRSARGYARVGVFTRQGLNYLTAIACQGKADVKRLRVLAGASLVIQYCGNIKFDLDVNHDITKHAHALRQKWGSNRLVWIAASTHAGEEEIILKVFQQLRQKLSHLLLILVPRHPERFDTVAQLCAATKLPYTRRSETLAPTPEVSLYLGDTMGDLLLLYAAADVAFIGGSLVPVGGHNPLEAAAVGTPVILGSHVFNFSEISQQLLAHGAGQQAKNEATLLQHTETYLSQPKLRQMAGQRGQQFVQHNRGALYCLLKLIGKVLN